jgi:hypothetical protein
MKKFPLRSSAQRNHRNTQIRLAKTVKALAQEKRKQTAGYIK